ncbi:hypothetical protein [Nocardioides sp. KR10-350]|uniref:hypothetical protein n=1 Tax=Nocardioides cheoyonin TaxID=3156615 RepID=UPI0032B47210
MTLRDACPLIEQALPKNEPVLMSDPQLHAAVKRLRGIGDTADIETQNLVRILVAPLEAAMDAGQGDASVDAFDLYTNALTTAKRRCEIAGSSAFAG